MTNSLVHDDDDDDDDDDDYYYYYYLNAMKLLIFSVTI